MTENIYINKTEQVLLSTIEELQNELKNCHEPEIQKELQERIDENFLTLGIFYKTYLYGEEKKEIDWDSHKKRFQDELSKLSREDYFKLFESKVIVPGWRYFKCDTCLLGWREACRDSESPSGEYCESCNEYIEPYDFEPHPEWPVDKSGNLIDEIEEECIETLKTVI